MSTRSTTQGSDQDPDRIKQLKKQKVVIEYDYTEKEVLLFNLACGAKATDLDLVYEGSPDFQVLPHFGVVPQGDVWHIIDFESHIDNFDHVRLLHGEQYLKFHGKIPTSARLISEGSIVEVLDKGKSAHIRLEMITRDRETGKVLIEAQGLNVIEGCGGFGGQTTASDWGAAAAKNKPPNREPDLVVEQQTSDVAAAIYRLLGDRNALHIDPRASARAGFDRPVVHGMSFLGIPVKHIVKSFGQISDLKVRFAGPLFPGETLVSKFWKEGNKVIFGKRAEMERRARSRYGERSGLCFPQS